MSTVPTVFARSLRKVTDAVRPRGNLDLLLRTIGLDCVALDEPALRIPYADFILLSEHASRMTKDAAFGLHVGETTRLESYGIVGYSIMTSSTLEEALRSQVLYLPIWTDSGQFSLRTDEPLAHFQWEFSSALLPDSRHDCEMSMATVTGYLSHLTRSRWQPAEVWFQHGPPKDASEHARIFRAPVRFAMPANALRFDRRLLSIPIASANPHAHEVIASTAKQLAARAPGPPTFSQAVLTLIRQRMETGDFGLDAISRTLAVSERTLQRRLREESTSHRRLIHQARQQLAHFLLTTLGATTVEAAYALGFSDPTAFYHAFRDWFGASPRTYRDTSGVSGATPILAPHVQRNQRSASANEIPPHNPITSNRPH